MQRPFGGDPPGTSRHIIAIPVRDEAQRIAACLEALARQAPRVPTAVVLLLNNCTDQTAAIVRALAPALPFPVRLDEVTLAPERAHAGVARSLAMASAAALADASGVVLTTDADGAAPPDWLARNRAALDAGAEAVMGRAVIDRIEARAIPRALHEADARECAYAALLDELAARIDPDPADPWPRHTEESGASIAVRVAAYRAVGGLAPIPLGEDRAFAERLRRAGRRVRHDPDVFVVVSGRTEGRAAGGMADTIRRRLTAPDLFLDDRLEPARDAVRRLRLRRAARMAHGAGRVPAELAAALGVSLPRLAELLAAECFGAAWAGVEAASPGLPRRPVPALHVVAEAGVARSLLARWSSRPDPLLSAAGATPASRIRAVAAE